MTNVTTTNGKVRQVLLSELHPSPENDRLYRPIDPTAPDLIELSNSLRINGVMEPLVATADGYLVSGHRRYGAARLAGLRSVPCRVLNVRRTDDVDAFVKLLREFNRQREKSLDERVREAVVDVNPAEAHAALVAERERKSDLSDRADVTPLAIDGVKRRKAISGALRPMLTAAQAVIESRRAFWPLSVRQVHYALLNDPPLRHAAKPASGYKNDRASYQGLTDLLTRARLIGLVPWQSISDETRPVTQWDVHPEPGAYVRKELSGFLNGYWRDLMRSQPNHVEIVGEKLTVRSIIDQVAGKYTIPVTIGRGYSSITPRREMAQRFLRSGKDKLIVLILSDHDPDGEEIAQSFARSMRDDFNLGERVVPVKVALTAEQVAAHRLPPALLAKTTSANHGKFAARHGRHAYELEAVTPEVLQGILTASIESVLDLKVFDAERRAEQNDSVFLAGLRTTVTKAMSGLDLGASHQPPPSNDDDDAGGEA